MGGDVVCLRELSLAQSKSSTGKTVVIFDIYISVYKVHNNSFYRGKLLKLLKNKAALFIAVIIVRSLGKESMFLNSISFSVSDRI